MSELREKVAAAISDVEYPRLVPKREHYAMADAAIALVRAETLEEAARVAEDWAERNVMDDTSWRDIKALIAAIRALESKP